MPAITWTSVIGSPSHQAHAVEVLQQQRLGLRPVPVPRPEVPGVVHDSGVFPLLQRATATGGPQRAVGTMREAVDLTGNPT